MSTGACRHRYAVIFDSHTRLCSAGILPMICPDCNTRFFRIEKRLFLHNAAPFIAAFVWIALAMVVVWHN